jgi:pimeloyl-ACP methyl ester carboxylesterase
VKPPAIAAIAITVSLTLLGCKADGESPVPDTSSSEAKMAHVGDIDMAYRTLGEGPPVVLIMGSGSTMDLWPPAVLAQLSASHQVILFDNRGMGRTTAPPGDFSIGQFADDTAGLMDALGIKSARVLGWSMGAFVAQELALNHPDKVDRLTLYAGDCGGPQAVPPSADVLEQLTDTSGTPQQRGMRLFNLLFPEEWLKSHPDFYKQFPVPQESSSPENIGRQAGACGTWAGTYDRLPGISKPTLVITGTEDRVAPPANALILVERIPRSWLVRVKDAGHGLMYQLPDQFSRLVLDFFDL